MKIAIELIAKMIHDLAMEYDAKNGGTTSAFADLTQRNKERYRYVAEKLLKALNDLS